MNHVRAICLTSSVTNKLVIQFVFNKTNTIGLIFLIKLFSKKERKIPNKKPLSTLLIIRHGPIQGMAWECIGLTFSDKSQPSQNPSPSSFDWKYVLEKNLALNFHLIQTHYTNGRFYDKVSCFYVNCVSWLQVT